MLTSHKDVASENWFGPQEVDWNQLSFLTGIQCLLAVIYLHEFIQKNTQGKDIPSNLDPCPKNNLIQFPIHDDNPSNEEVGAWVDKLLQKKSSVNQGLNPTGQATKESDPTYQLAEILLENGII